MECDSIKLRKECLFMTKKGCSFDNGKCDPIVEQCSGCLYIEEWPPGKYCSIYARPESKWINFTCPKSTHVVIEVRSKEKFVDPIKASKRKAKGM